MRLRVSIPSYPYEKSAEWFFQVRFFTSIQLNSFHAKFVRVPNVNPWKWFYEEKTTWFSDYWFGNKMSFPWNGKVEVKLIFLSVDAAKEF